MVTVLLAREWTDAAGTEHPQGAQVQIDEALLDELVAAGFVNLEGDENVPGGMRWS